MKTHLSKINLNTLPAMTNNTSWYLLGEQFSRFTSKIFVFDSIDSA